MSIKTSDGVKDGAPERELNNNQPDNEEEDDGNTQQSNTQEKGGEDGTNGRPNKQTNK